MRRDDEIAETVLERFGTVLFVALVTILAITGACYQGFPGAITHLLSGGIVH